MRAPVSINLADSGVFRWTSRRVGIYQDETMSHAEAVAAAREACKATIGPSAAEYDRAGRFPDRSIQALRDARMLGLTVPAAQGGLGLGPSAFVAVVEEIASACPSTAMIYVMHVCATQVIGASAHPRRDDLLRAIARGDHLTTLAFSEKGSRSNFWAPVSRAKRNGSGHVLAAEKSWVTSAGHATSYVVSTLAVDGKTPVESTLYLVEKGAAGLDVAGAWDGLGMRANASAPMKLADCKVPADAMLCGEGKGFDTMLGVVLPWFQIGASAVANGIGLGALGAAGGHLVAARLEHMGEALSSLPTVRAQLARARVRLDASRAHTAQTARSMESPDDGTMLLVLESKALASETALETTDAAMRLCGGAAFSRHLPVERLFRDARAGAVMAPTTDHLHEFIGKALLGIPLF
jgi:alkylation response protein AidB-like acyl-CoA dehydrogenase